MKWSPYTFSYQSSSHFDRKQGDNFFPPLWCEFLQQLSNIPYSSVNYSYHVVYTEFQCLFLLLEVCTFEHFHPVLSLLIPCSWQPQIWFLLQSGVFFFFLPLSLPSFFPSFLPFIYFLNFLFLFFFPSFFFWFPSLSLSFEFGIYVITYIIFLFLSGLFY